MIGYVPRKMEKANLKGGEIVEKALFGGEYIINRERTDRPVVTVNRTGKGLANKETDLICCGMCGSIMTYKAKFCFECGAKFKKVKDVQEYRKLQESEDNLCKHEENLCEQITLEGVIV